ncbi:MAG TPA: formate dehydrogenase accessory protein FdhE [Candidatus Solibacter sp.]|nr:formate dehydrogenase accessory protein FdhE [Candidatus Solibacter sp.]
MTRWERRIARAEELTRESPVYPEVLHFYIEIAKFQANPTRNLDALRELVRRSAPNPAEGDPMHAFYSRVMAQADAEERAHHAKIATSVQPVCPFCGEKPVAAVLRPEGDGAKRFLLCSLCFTEWEFRRLLCPNCGEEDKEKLPVYTAEEFAHVRVEACDTCKVYLKAVDLTKNGLAVPEVDELASVVLDIWASEHGYTKLQTNLFGM